MTPTPNGPTPRTRWVAASLKTGKVLSIADTRKEIDRWITRRTGGKRDARTNVFRSDTFGCRESEVESVRDALLKPAPYERRNP